WWRLTFVGCSCADESVISTLDYIERTARERSSRMLNSNANVADERKRERGCSAADAGESQARWQQQDRRAGHRRGSDWAGVRDRGAEDRREGESCGQRLFGEFAVSLSTEHVVLHYA